MLEHYPSEILTATFDSCTIAPAASDCGITSHLRLADQGSSAFFKISELSPRPHHMRTQALEGLELSPDSR
ncbi:hypothetical protein PM082_004849 [Marasmius tenuissimus]|nr:hypothetical protein PM082_004849 [Marasmius tenuissimus]